MTQVNAETVWPVSPGSNLINQCSMAIDSNNRPHIAYYANDFNGVPQYQHLWFDGKSWQQKTVSNRIEKFNLQGPGTLKLPISRPEIVIDSKDKVFILYRGDVTGNSLGFSSLELEGGKYKLCEIDKILLDKDMDFSEPVIDRTRWSLDNKLTVLWQKNHQPNGDDFCEVILSKISFVDFQFSI